MVTPYPCHKISCDIERLYTGLAFCLDTKREVGALGLAGSQEEAGIILRARPCSFFCQQIKLYRLHTTIIFIKSCFCIHYMFRLQCSYLQRQAGHIVF
jgi:hypothetical protein